MRATITLSVEISDESKPVGDVRGALEALAEIMLVQAEDGLWTHGSPEPWNDDDDNVKVADITASSIDSVAIQWVSA